MALHLRAHAKVNLHLRVVGKRPDGYHELETLFQQIELHDDLWCEGCPGDSVSLELAGDVEVPAGGDNLVMRAAKAFFDATGTRRGVRFLLQKRIPLGAGLGGGSSDAAAVLRLLNASSEEPLADEHLFDVARRLGADVPFFLAGGTQWGAGIGDVLVPVRDAPDWQFVLLLPPFSCATAAVYKNHRAQLIPAPGTASITTSKVLFYKELQVRGELTNDLEEAAMELYPQLKGIRDRAVRLGCRNVRLTGSGSTLFAAFESAGEAEAAAQRLLGLQADGVRILLSRSTVGDCPPAANASWPEGQS